MDTDLAVDAMIAYLHRYGGIWSGDEAEVRQALTKITEAAMDLAGDDLPSWGPAKDLLNGIISSGGQIPE